MSLLAPIWAGRAITIGDNRFCLSIRICYAKDGKHIYECSPTWLAGIFAFIASPLVYPFLHPLRCRTVGCLTIDQGGLLERWVGVRAVR